MDASSPSSLNVPGKQGQVGATFEDPLQEDFYSLSSCYDLERIPTVMNLGSLHLFPPSLWGLPASSNGEFRTPLLLGGRRLSLLHASFCCPAMPGEEWLTLSNSRMEFQKAHLAADPRPHSPKKHVQ